VKMCLCKTAAPNDATRLLFFSIFIVLFKLIGHLVNRILSLRVVISDNWIPLYCYGMLYKIINSVAVTADSEFNSHQLSLLDRRHGRCSS
jgi:hypothetical protein